MKNRITNFIIKIVIILFVIVACIFAAYIYSNAKQEEGNTTDKVEEEIDYLDVKLTSLINNLNGIQLENYKISVTKIQEEESKSDTTEEKKSEEGTEQSNQEEQEGSNNGQQTQITQMEKEQTVENTQEVNWGALQGDAEVFYSIWASIVLDLYEIGVESNKIVEFSKNIDEALINIKAKDKAKSVESFAKLYNLLPEFAKKSDIEEVKKTVIETKSNIMQAYAKVEKEEWDKVTEETKNAENKFLQIINNISKKEDKRKFNINKSYILIQELKNSLSTKDKGIFYIKYKNLIEELNTLI